MRLAVVSDIHGNLAALDAVLADLATVRPDLVVHGGDLALNGPHPAECVDRVRELGWPGVVGNTDQALWTLPPTLPENTLKVFRVLIAATAELLGGERIGWLQTLAAEWRDGNDVALVHAVPGDTWKGVLPHESDAALRTFYAPLRAALAVYGHIHRPYVRRMPDLIVANCGSVGLPWDGDPRAAYLLVENGEPAIRRVGYDVGRHVADLQTSEYPSSQYLIEQARTASGGFVRINT